MQPRKEDKDGNGYAKRKIFDVKTLIVLFTAMFGTGGITGITSYLTDPNLVVQAKVDKVTIKTQSHDIDINSLKAEVLQKSMRMEYYIKSHSNEEDLRQQLIDKEFKHIRELLVEIKDDLEIIKNGH